MQVGHVYSTRALLTAPVHSYPENAAASQVMAGKDVVSGAGASSSFYANVVMILAVLLCALGLKSIVRCALRCSSRTMPPAGAEQQRRQQPEEALALARLAQAGARRKALRAIPTLVYSAELPLQAGGGGPACAVCLADLVPGDRVRVLPECDHGFHARCVDRWLVARSTCPTCRQPLFGAPQKGSGCAHGGNAEPPVQAFLAPLRSESFITPYDF